MNKYFSFNSKRPGRIGGQNRKGFSLIEIMVVITLLGILGTVVVRNVTNNLTEGKFKATEAKLRNIQAALADYYRTCSSYPTNAQGGLQALITKPTLPPECKGYDPNGYLSEKKLPLDAWDRDIIYINEDGSSRYILKSLGADGKEGGEGYDRDIDVNNPS